MTEDEARTELAQHGEWLNTFQAQQQQAPTVMQRVAWLNGWLEATASED